MALDSFGLYVHQSQDTDGELQVKIFHIVFDILMLYGVGFLEVKGHGVRSVLHCISRAQRTKADLQLHLFQRLLLSLNASSNSFSMP